MSQHKNCINCGAPRSGNKCEYCRSTFFDEINLRYDGEQMSARAAYNFSTKSFISMCTASSYSPEFYSVKVGRF